ncbi:hypothetical protein KXW98_007114 [Aspergillus fumigatus]|uniref:Uncharacterized protein n=2 Tax=Aspergillus fumigatus TaxID=746128 RepID=Q4WLZ1_ASPFU|nr:conserved hypothetical protein [Aspergillus fumigatus Af293]KAF4257120.1 hypothetical protein CNMCM8057_003775 [Aspergillus fumigatus]KMK63480.1 hypothetical protein Y699_04310 [Aspergillus fumigatus Z5]EAL89023.1 conserved hypothetical protein [Aspergillus fumigatus Af293]KAF4260077.1 hypothetical protein CNMCM8714_001314 [Aspergillus fumigatus]KAF4268310.1 hypothetical protein CNMCM8812_001892 [Aspergillus fumigatus]
MSLTQTEKDTEVFTEDKSSTLSLTSTLTCDTLDEKHFAFFHPSRTLHIAAQGIAAFRLPFPSRELEIPIYDTADGTIAYVSTRSSICSGNAILSDPHRGDLVRTEYFFGPARDPVISIIDASKNQSLPIKISSRWTSRATSFNTPDGWTLEWSYTKREDSNGQKENVIVLQLKDVKSKKHGKVLAQLLRGSETRTAGSSRCHAGNGGDLLIDEEAEKFVEEPLLVATCLLMLKREIDRRRAMQFMMVGAISS